MELHLEIVHKTSHRILCWCIFKSAGPSCQNIFSVLIFSLFQYFVHLSVVTTTFLLSVVLINSSMIRDLSYPMYMAVQLGPWVHPRPIFAHVNISYSDTVISDQNMCKSSFMKVMNWKLWGMKRCWVISHHLLETRQKILSHYFQPAFSWNSESQVNIKQNSQY